MTSFELMEIKRNLIKDKLSKVSFPPEKETTMCWAVGADLGITGVTVKNYLKGYIKDGYLAEAILNECKRLKLTK